MRKVVWRIGGILALVALTASHVAGVKLQGRFDVYNLFNSSTILSVNGTYGPQWLRPQAILGARLVKFGAQLDW